MRLSYRPDDRVSFSVILKQFSRLTHNLSRWLDLNTYIYGIGEHSGGQSRHCPHFQLLDSRDPIILIDKFGCELDFLRDDDDDSPVTSAHWVSSFAGVP